MNEKFTISNMDKNQLVLLCDAIDFYIRIMLGQLEYIPMKIEANVKGADSNNTIDPFSKEMEDIRTKISTVYKEHGIPGTGSFGIHSEEIDDRIRVLYDMYKVMMYEMRAGGVYAFKPSPIAKDHHDQIKMSCNDEKIIEYDDDQKALRDIIGDHNVREFEDEPGVPYVRSGEYTWTKLSKGLKLRIKHNGVIEVLAN